MGVTIGGGPSDVRFMFRMLRMTRKKSNDEAKSQNRCAGIGASQVIEIKQSNTNRNAISVIITMQVADLSSLKTWLLRKMRSKPILKALLELFPLGKAIAG